jgi:hypothetical protein
LKRTTLYAPGTWSARQILTSLAQTEIAFGTRARMNRALFASRSAADGATTLSHPEYGSLTVDGILHQMAGHQIHRLKQLEEIATRR